MPPSSYFVPSSPVNVSALACASGLYALLEAQRLILSGEADAIICGGTDAAITLVMFAGLGTMGAMSRRNDDPGGASRLFSADRDGFVFGEGAVAAVVETAEHARWRGVIPYAAVAGGALTCDAFHISAPEPTAEHATEAIRQAQRRFGVHPSDLDYICAHGTSMAANDVTETLDYVSNVARRLPVRVAATNAFGFGGQNCVAVLTTPPASPRTQRPSRTDASRFFTSAWTTTATSRNQAR